MLYFDPKHLPEPKIHLRRLPAQDALRETSFMLIDHYGSEAGWIRIRHHSPRQEELAAPLAGYAGYEVFGAFRRRGYGTAMLALAKHEAKKLGLSEIRLTCGPKNVGSRKIIEKNGGSLVGVNSETGDLLYVIGL